MSHIQQLSPCGWTLDSQVEVHFFLEVLFLTPGCDKRSGELLVTSASLKHPQCTFPSPELTPFEKVNGL